MHDFTHPPVWQRNYYEHVIRNENGYDAIWKYIKSNPGTWIDDQFISSTLLDKSINDQIALD